jgi:HPt (histidine-containing phosphotransfer) domain-containing protein
MDGKQSQHHRQHFTLSEGAKQKLEALTAQRYPGRQRRQSQLVEDLITEAFMEEQSMNTVTTGMHDPGDPFWEEVRSYLPEIEEDLLRLAQSPINTNESVERMCRHTHTIGGAASMMDFPGLAHVAHGMEDILGDALDGVSTLNEPTLDFLKRALGRLRLLLEGIRNGVDEKAVIAEDDADFARYRALVETSSHPSQTARSQIQATTPPSSTPEKRSTFSEVPSILLPVVSHCPSCEQAMQANWKHCVYCGTSLVGLCSECGAVQPHLEGVRFCYECGNPLV